MNSDQNHFKNRLRKLNLIIYAMISGVTIFIIVSVFLRYTGVFYTIDYKLDEIFKFLVPVFVFAGYLLGKTLFKIQLRKVAPDQDLLIKFNNYQIGTIVQSALLEVPGILAVIAFLFTGRSLYIGFAILSIFAMYFSRPTIAKVSAELELTVDEKQQFEAE